MTILLVVTEKQEKNRREFLKLHRNKGHMDSRKIRCLPTPPACGGIGVVPSPVFVFLGAYRHRRIPVAVTTHGKSHWGFVSGYSRPVLVHRA